MAREVVETSHHRKVAVMISGRRCRGGRIRERPRGGLRAWIRVILFSVVANVVR
jgi:hypothetical protein